MKNRALVLGLVICTLVTGCKSLEGAARAVKNLTGNNYHEGFSGTYISQTSLHEYKQRDDQLSGKGGLISYSGMDIPAEHVRKLHVVDSPELTGYLQGIVDDLLLKWDGSSVKAQVQIINSQSFAPYADPYGMIRVPLGMLQNVESEDEIALLLAHELSHLLLRHHERDEVMKQQQELVTDVASAVILASMAKDTKVVKGSNGISFNYNPSEQGKKNITKAGLYNYVINGVSDSIWSTAWQRSQEDEADLLGMDLTVSAGYAPRASVYTLQRLADFQGKQKGILSSFWDQKTSAIEGAINNFDLAGFSQHLDSFLSEGLGALVSSATDFFKRSHMSPESRDLNLRDYVRREYSDKVRVRVQPASWEEVRSNPRVKQVFEGYQYAFLAAAELSDGNSEGAEILALRSLNPVVKNHPGIREVLYNLRVAQYQTVKARKNLEYIDNWEHASPDLFDKKVDLELAAKNYQSALQYIELAENTFGSSEMFIVKKAIALGNLGQEQETIAALEQCKRYKNERETCSVLLEKFQQAV